MPIGTDSTMSPTQTTMACRTFFEVNFGLNRTVSMHNGLLEAEADNDNDGLSNLDEYTLGGHPLNPDTDGDCILDAVEVSWAQHSSRPICKRCVAARCNQLG